jgi:hypothetical protein
MTDDTWEKLCTVLIDTRSVDDIRTRLADFAELSSEAAMVVSFLDERDAGAVAGPVVRVLEEALDRLAPKDPMALELLAVLRPA